VDPRILRKHTQQSSAEEANSNPPSRPKRIFLMLTERTPRQCRTSDQLTCGQVQAISG